MLYPVQRACHVYARTSCNISSCAYMAEAATWGMDRHGTLVKCHITPGISMPAANVFAHLVHLVNVRAMIGSNFANYKTYCIQVSIGTNMVCSLVRNGEGGTELTRPIGRVLCGHQSLLRSCSIWMLPVNMLPAANGPVVIQT